MADPSSHRRRIQRSQSGSIDGAAHRIAVGGRYQDRDRRWQCPLLIASALLTVSSRPEVDSDELVTRMPDDDGPVGFRDAHDIIP